jgi:hypothetical protein
MMGDRQAAFRREYRAGIRGWYNGYVHIAVIYAIGLTAMWVYLQHIGDVRPWEWAIVPVTFVGCNIFEWFLHKYVMHRRIDFFGLRAIYERHTLNHHRFFTDDEVRFRDHGDWRVTVFPPYALVIFIMMSLPGVAVLAFLFTPNVGWLFICTTTSMYLIYEFMHFCCHVDENAFVRHVPFINTLRRHHVSHHNVGLMMDTNMNLTFPIADWLFGTSDLDRGLLGHIFNGYDTSHLKANLARRPRSPVEATADPIPAE